MARFLGVGNGSTGAVDLGSFSQAWYSCAGTAGATTLTATGTFNPGDRLFIHQTRGSGAGNYEDNAVASYVAGTVTLVHPLEHTYADSGNNQAQVGIVPNANSVTGSLTTYAWDGNVGGITVIACNGAFSGTIDASAKGYLGGIGFNQGTYAGYGEGHPGARYGVIPGASSINNGNGGGSSNFGSGASGGHATAGSAGLLAGSSDPGKAGEAVGTPEMGKIFFGGGAGGSWGAESLKGGNGGGAIIIYASEFTSTASLLSNGENGVNHVISGGSGSSGGAGGSILIKGIDVTLGVDKLKATGGTPGFGSLNGVTGVNGANGRIRIEACKFSGSSNPVPSLLTGGHSYCGSGGLYIF